MLPGLRALKGMTCTIKYDGDFHIAVGSLLTPSALSTLYTSVAGS